MNQVKIHPFSTVFLWLMRFLGDFPFDLKAKFPLVPIWLQWSLLVYVVFISCTILNFISTLKIILERLYGFIINIYEAVSFVLYTLRLITFDTIHILKYKRIRIIGWKLLEQSRGVDFQNTKLNLTLTFLVFTIFGSILSSGLFLGYSTSNYFYFFSDMKSI